MAKRPIFIVTSLEKGFVVEEIVEFKWFNGLNLIQKQKSIDSLHKSAQKIGNFKILEISTKSNVPLGVKLSAFNLKYKYSTEASASVESLYQGSKVFEKGGPFIDIYKKNSYSAKKDIRLRNSGKIIGFSFLNENWELEPKTAFYDFLYMNALYQNKILHQDLIKYDAFTDIEFNPLKQINCQARSVAYFVSLFRQGLVEKFISNKNSFLEIYFQNKNNQPKLF